MLSPNDLESCISAAQRFEQRIIADSSNQAEYTAKMQAKLNQITQKREENASNMPLGMPNMPGNMNGGTGMPNTGNMSGMMNNPMGMPNGQPNLNASGQQNLVQLRGQMQPSQIPPGTIDPGAFQNGNMMNQTPNRNQMNMQAAQTNNGLPPGIQISPQEISAMVQQLHGQMTDEQKVKARNQALSVMSEAERADLNAKNDDALRRYLMHVARKKIIDMKLRKQQQQQQQQGGGDGSQMNNPQVANNHLPQQGGPQPSIDLNQFLSQQAMAKQQQESGEQVVPASNNINFGLGNMPQNVNPAMLSQNGQQPNNKNNPQALQQAMMQQNQHRMMMARQHALQQQQQHANQLRGQPGGLNAPNALNGGPAGQLNSPAMSMLNRPMAPPGQNAPATPQQGRAQQPPQTPANNATAQLLQHAQQMRDQNAQNSGPSGQGMPQQPPSANMHPSMQAALASDGFRNVLKNLQPELRAHVTQAIQNRRTLQEVMNIIKIFQARAASMAAGNNAQTQSGALNLPINGVAQSQPGSAIPQFNSQPPLNQQQQAPQIDPMQLQQRMQQQQAASQIPPQFRQRAFDMHPYPPGLPNSVGLNVPDGVKTWGHLKQYVLQNQANLQPGTLERIQAFQTKFFQQRPDDAQNALNALKRILMQQGAQKNAQMQLGPGGPGAPGAQNMQMPAGQAPPAQMIPPTAPMQAPNQTPGPAQGMNQGQMQRPMPHVPMPTDADVARFRQALPQQAMSMTDEDIKGIILRRTREKQMRQMQQNHQQQEALRNAQMQRAQQQQASQNQQGQRVPQQPTPKLPPAGQQTPVQGQKRPQQNHGADADVVEIPNPNAQGAQQNLIASMMASMTPAQRQQFSSLPQEKQREALNRFREREQQKAANQQRASLVKAQSELGSGNQGAAAGDPHQQPLQPLQPPQASSNDPQERARYIHAKAAAMYKQIELENPKGPAVPMDGEALQQAQQMLRGLYQPATKVHQTFYIALTNPGLDDSLRKAMRAKVLVLQNMNSDGSFRGHLSLRLDDIKQLGEWMRQYMVDVKAAKDGPGNQKNQQQPPAQMQSMPPSSGKAQQAQPQTASMAQTASQQGHIHKASAASKASPAPTDNKTFDWGAPSPHGVPKYDARAKELTPDKLKFPPVKKRKTGAPGQETGSAASTPVGGVSTPAAMTGSPSLANKTGASASPEALRKVSSQQQQAQSQPQQPIKRFRCPEDWCEGHLKGFETEELLRAHGASEHAPVGDPLDFFVESAAAALGVDKDTGMQAKAKSESGAKASATKPAGEPKQQTLREMIEDKMGFEPAAFTTEDKADEVTDFSFDNNMSDLFNDELAGYNEYAELSSITNWGLRPEAMASESSPELTPPSEDSSHASDVSQTERLVMNLRWDAEGTGEAGHVPEALRAMALEGKKKDGDIAVAEEEDEFAWATAAGDPPTWADMFGENAGLEGLEME